MTGYERITAALQGRWPDTTPVMLHNFRMAAREAGVSMTVFRSDPRELARSFIEAVERYGYDGIIIDVDTVTLAGAAGVPVDFPVDQPARVKGSLVATLEAVRDLLPVAVSEYPGVQVWLEAARLLKRHFNEEIFLRGNCDQCPFSLASLLRGMDNWMRDLLEPDLEELIHVLLLHCTDITRQFVREMASTGVHMISNGDSVASPDLISPVLFRRFALPYERRIVEAAHALTLPYILHICGNTNLILDDMVTSGADGLEIDSGTNSLMAHEKLRHRTVFVGNLDPTGVLARGTPSLVEEKTRDLLHVFSDTPRFILNAGCAISPETPPQNIRTMIRVAREFRR